MEQSLEKRKRKREQSESWYQNWFSTSPWLSTLLPSVLGPFIGLLLLISFGPWAFKKLTVFIKTQVDSATKGTVAVHYHRLSLSDPQELEFSNTPKPEKGLQFAKLAKGTKPFTFTKWWSCP